MVFIWILNYSLYLYINKQLVMTKEQIISEIKRQYSIGLIDWPMYQLQMAIVNTPNPVTTSLGLMMYNINN